MQALIDATSKVANIYALAAFLGLLLLIALVVIIRQHGKPAALDKRQSDLMALGLKLLFGLAALALVTLSNGGKINGAGCTSGNVGDTINNNKGS